MKKILIGIFVILLLCIAGCGPKAAPTKEDTEPQQQVVQKEPETKPEPKTETKPAEPVKKISSEVADLISNTGKIKNYEFTYVGPPDRQLSYRVFIKDNKWKYDHANNMLMIDRIRFDTIFLDTSTNTAFAYCEDEGDCDEESRGIQQDVDYEDYAIISPLDKLDQVISAEKTGEETLDGRKTWICDYELRNGEKGRMWLDDYYGVPMKFDNGNAPQLTEYRDLAVNSVQDSDVTVQE